MSQPFPLEIFSSFSPKKYFLLPPFPSETRGEHVTCHSTGLALHRRQRSINEHQAHLRSEQPPIVAPGAPSVIRNAHLCSVSISSSKSRLVTRSPPPLQRLSLATHSWGRRLWRLEPHLAHSVHVTALGLPRRPCHRGGAKRPKKDKKWPPRHSWCARALREALTLRLSSL